MGAQHVDLTQFEHGGALYEISTINLDMLSGFAKSFVDVADSITGASTSDKRYETMLFIDGQSTEIYPFGSLPEGLCGSVSQHYATYQEAKEGHNVFVAGVKSALGVEV